MRLQVGRIGRAHGIAGEATVELRTDDPDARFAVGATVQTDSHGSLKVRSGRVHNGILLLAFEGYDDRSAVEKLRDVIMYSDVDVDAPGGDPDDYHVQQLIGCRALLEDGTEFGRIVDVLNLPGQDVLVIDGLSGEVMIPFVRELVPLVDIGHKTITVIPPTISGVIDEA